MLIAIQQVTRATGTEYYLTQMIMAAYYSTLVMGLCLLMGYAGQVSLGHGAFFAIGGYTSAILTTTHLEKIAGSAWAEKLVYLGILNIRQNIYGAELTTFSPSFAFIMAMLITFVIALLIGWPALRLKGHYLAMATLGFGLIIYRILLGTAFMGAADGITGVPAWELPAGIVISGRRPFRVVNYYFAWSFALVALCFLLNIVRSGTGRAMRAIHDNELGANAMGVNTASLKLKAFVISAVLAAACGSLLTHYNAGIGPSEAEALKSVRYVALLAAGGMANLWGALIVSAILNFLSLRGYFGTYDHAVFGLILIIIVSLCPAGPFKPAHLFLKKTFAAACKKLCTDKEKRL